MGEGSNHFIFTPQCVFNLQFVHIFQEKKIPCFWRSRCRCVLYKKGVYKNFAKFTGKHLCQRLFFNQVAGLSAATLLKKGFWHRCFPVNYAKFLRAPFLQNPSGRLLLKILAFAHWFWEKRHLRNKDFEKRALYIKPWYIGYRDFKKGALYVSHHGCPTNKILGFRWSKKAKITLKPKSFWRSISASIFEFFAFLHIIQASIFEFYPFLHIIQASIFEFYPFLHIIHAVDEILSIFQILKTLS